MKNNKIKMEVITECVVQTIVYISYIKCMRCHMYIEPQTKCVRIVCSCGCGCVKQLCNCCSLGITSLHDCMNKRKEKEEEEEEFINQICKEKQYMNRKFK